jgi:hypothetical protein
MLWWAASARSDSVVVVGQTEPQRIFELLGRKGEVAGERLALRDAYVEALDAYRRKDWEKAIAGFEDCLAIVPCDAPTKLLPRTHRAVPRHRPICRVEWRLVAGVEVGTAALLRAVCRRSSWHPSPAPDERYRAGVDPSRLLKSIVTFIATSTGGARPAPRTGARGWQRGG